MRKLFDKKTLEVCTKEGLTTRAIAHRLGVHTCTIQRWLNRYNLHSTKAVHRRKRNYLFNTRYFSVIDSSEKAYFLGFIAADGSIERNWGLKVKIRTRDIEFLHKLAEAVTFTGRIRTHGEDSILALYDIDLVKDLAQYGVVQRKTSTLPFMRGVPAEYAYDYIRGYMDGDGHVSRNAGFVTGSNRFYIGFMLWCTQVAGVNPWTKFEDGTKWRVIFNKRDREFIRRVYGQGKWALSRKLARCREFGWLLDDDIVRSAV